MNEQYFCRFFKKALGKSPVTYINEYRIKQAITLLQATDAPIMEICLDCGFNNLGNFLREFKSIQALRPSSIENIILWKSHNIVVFNQIFVRPSCFCTL